MRRVLYHLFMRSPSIWLHVFLCFVPLLHWVMFSSIWSSVFFSHTDHVFFQLVMWSSTLSCDLPPCHVIFRLVMSCDLPPCHVIFHLVMWSSTWSCVLLPGHVIFHLVKWSSTWSCVLPPGHVFFHLVMWSSTLSCDLPPGHVFFHLVIFIQDICFSTSAGHVCRLHKPSSLFLIARPHERDFIRAGEKTRGSEASTEDGFGELV